MCLDTSCTGSALCLETYLMLYAINHCRTIDADNYMLPRNNITPTTTGANTFTGTEETENNDTDALNIMEEE